MLSLRNLHRAYISLTLMYRHVKTPYLKSPHNAVGLLLLLMF